MSREERLKVIQAVLAAADRLIMTYETQTASVLDLAADLESLRAAVNAARQVSREERACATTR